MTKPDAVVVVVKDDVAAAADVTEVVARERFKFQMGTEGGKCRCSSRPFSTTTPRSVSRDNAQ